MHELGLDTQTWSLQRALIQPAPVSPHSHLIAYTEVRKLLQAIFKQSSARNPIMNFLLAPRLRTCPSFREIAPFLVLEICSPVTDLQHQRLVVVVLHGSLVATALDVLQLMD